MIIRRLHDGSYEYKLSPEELSMDSENFKRFIDFAIEESKTRERVCKELSDKLLNSIDIQMRQSISVMNRERELQEKLHNELKIGILDIFKNYSIPSK
jgi:hypothetical protein